MRFPQCFVLAHCFVCPNNLVRVCVHASILKKPSGLFVCKTQLYMYNIYLMLSVSVFLCVGGGVFIPFDSSC